MQPGRLSLGVSKIFTPLTAGGKRQRAAAAMLLLAFTTSLFFYGIGVNLTALLVVAVLLMLTLSTLGISRLAAAFLTNRSCWGALLAIAYLCISYRWSVSPDSSFAPSFILAGLPLAFIAATAINLQLRQLLLPALMVIIVAFAVHSLADFLIAGERAHAPMTDPNNYATLMYLCWIPLVHSQLSRSWTRTTEQTRAPRWQSLWRLLPEFVLLMAMFATY